MKLKKKIRNQLKPTSVILIIFLAIKFYSCSFNNRNRSNGKINFCTIKYNIVQADSFVQYYPKYLVEVKINNNFIIWNTYLPNYLALQSRGKIMNVDTFYVKNKQVFNKVKGLEFLYYDSLNFEQSNITFFRVSDPNIQNSFLIRKFSFDILDTTYVKNIKVFKSILNEGHFYINKADFYNLSVEQVSNLEFNFSSKSIVYMNPIVGILGYEEVGFEGFSYYLDSINVAPNCSRFW